MRTRPVVALTFAFVSAAAPARAQQGRVVLEGGAARALPPAGVGGDAATYGVGGVRGEWSGARGSLAAAGYAGRAMNEHGSDFVSGAVGGELWARSPGSVNVGVGGAVQAFMVGEPLLYRLSAAEISPLLGFGGDRAGLVVRGRFGAGSARIELHRAGSIRRARRELATRGADAELRLASSGVALTATVGLHRAHAGDFGRAGVRVVAQPGPVTLRLEGEVWDTPTGGETVGGITLSIPVGRLETRAIAARTAPDPLTLVDPGVQNGLVLGLRLASFGRAGAGAAVHEVLRPGRPARVRVRVAPPGARTVEVLGDFNGWSPAALAPDGGGWSLELDVEPGTYHFGFLVDGRWWIPDGAWGTVPDEWGRRNVTMVVGDEERP